MSEEIEVAVDLDSRTVRVGRARIDRRRSTTTTAFTYDPAYLSDPDAYEIDPALQFDSRGGLTSGLRCVRRLRPRPVGTAAHHQADPRDRARHAADPR